MPKTQLHSARTALTDPAAAAEDLMNQLGGAIPKLVTMFASSNRDQRALNKAVRERLPKTTRLIGSTSGAEIDRQGLHRNTVVLGALTGDFEVGLGLGKGLSEDAIAAGLGAVAQASAELGVRPADLQTTKHVGMVMDDASKMKKEELLLGMLEKNQSLVLVGGGASDQEPIPSAQRPLLHVDGEVVDDAALLAIIRTDAPWAALRSHWYEPTGQMITITKVDESHTRALEIDGKPAASRYAELLGVGPEDLGFDKLKGFASTSTALKVGREYFMRSPMFPLPDGSILFTNLLDEGAELELMKLGDMGSHTRKFFEVEVPRRVQSPQAAILFHCSGRAFSAANMGNIGAVSEAFQAAPPCVGLNVNFEIYCGFSINTTLTALVFGEKQ
jgi:hypothetical protein